ncbi:LeuD/DmdB family oxidoreductase small subunit [Pelosinus propionicus]|uniref:3-isopropylmalate dehydratase small subunit n=1 Tax=Pelosinus propionicus DSM 13327 TaxID=1123291 RepID=A0A1I4MXY5_9FIRM|nr:3-isopropylmalate dehydratase [Pelosinus propionicus]SFM07946.1 3-isopropylmalate dehydratase, small subunit [Pelosinus propionicus DSM 13327]
MKEAFKGRVWKLGDDIDTDIIIPTQFLALKTVEDMKKYAFNPLRPELAAQIQPGDIIVAGKNFGCGSSREQAPEILAALKISCIIAKSYARIFYRNAFNNGLLLLENNELYDCCREGDEVSVQLENSQVLLGEKSFEVASIPTDLLQMVEAGGLVPFMRKRNGK